MNRLCPLFFVFLLVLVSCGKKYSIKGSSDVSVIDGKVIYLKSGNEESWKVVDSAEIVHGKFLMKGKLDSVQVVSIFMDGEHYMPMVLENGSIDMEITPTGFNVTGTPLNDRLYAFFHEKNSLDEQLEEAAHIESKLILAGSSPETAHRRSAEKVAEVTAKIRMLTKSFIEDNYDNILGPTVFLMVCASSFPYPLITPELQEIYDNGPASFREFEDLKKYVSKAQENVEFLKEVERHRQNNPDVDTRIPLPQNFNQ